jgi:hypothetical protein
MPLCDHLDDFNRIILDIKNIDIKVDDEDQALILLCPLVSNPFDNLINSMLYCRDTISVADVNYDLNSLELRIRLNCKGSDNHAEGLFVKRSENSSNFRGRSSGRDSHKGG